MVTEEKLVFYVNGIKITEKFANTEVSQSKIRILDEGTTSAYHTKAPHSNEKPDYKLIHYTRLPHQISQHDIQQYDVILAR